MRSFTFRSAVERIVGFLNKVFIEPCLLPTDASIVILRKKLFIFVSASVFMALCTTWNYSNTSQMERLAYVSGITHNVLTYAGIRVWRSCSDRFIAVATISATIPIILFDLIRASSMQSRSWPLFVLIMDTQLVCRTWNLTTTVTISICLGWITLCGIESAQRFGLFDIIFLPSQSSRHQAICSCTELPCPDSYETQFSLTTVGILVFMLDFYCTRSFCTQLYREKDRIEASVSAANDVAQSLALFDLRSAEVSLVEASDRIPERMATALETLLGNLKEYRPYLPEALFSAMDETVESAVITAPGKGCRSSEEEVSQEVEVGILFSDIVSSTSSWEAYPDAMRIALRIHNEIMRQQAILFRGYEVKTIGDAFMYSFNTPLESCQFALNVQDIFSRTDWPGPIQKLNNGQGLLIRIGLVYGNCHRETNPTTKRSDYLGSLVNKAARIEGCCLPGCIALDAETTHQISEEVTALGGLLDPLGAPQVVKGMKHPIQLYSLIPQQLSYRLRGTAFTDTAVVRVDSFSETSSCTSTISLDNRIHQNVKSSSTVCSVLMGSTNADPICIMMERIERVSRTLDRTGGTILSLNGAVVTLGFNVTRPCKSHLESSFRFAVLLGNYIRSKGERLGAHLGISTGVCSNNLVINTSEQRFITSIGVPISLSFFLCMSAAEMNRFALFSQLGEHQSKRYLRRVNEWLTSDYGTLEIYELQIAHCVATYVHDEDLSEFEDNFGEQNSANETLRSSSELTGPSQRSFPLFG